MFYFDMSMTLRETWYFLFGKKHCPDCDARLYRQINTSDEGFGWHRDGTDFEYAHTTKATAAYECRRCRVWYPLSTLANRRAP